MIGSIGFPEIVLIFIVVLLLFGPKKLPEFAKLMGKTLREFRRTINEAKATIEDEIEKADISKDLKEIEHEIKDATNIDKVIENIDVAKDLKAIEKDIKDITRIEDEEEKKPE